MLWEQEGKPERLLLLGADLTAAEQDDAVRASELTHRQQEFLEASRRADEIGSGSAASGSGSLGSNQRGGSGAGRRGAGGG